MEPQELISLIENSEFINQEDLINKFIQVRAESKRRIIEILPTVVSKKQIPAVTSLLLTA
ncbi:hypothetical protein [Candidatus Uabimicrobium sp. HlEnr_7]|uniref:hypothetical protein n=1 Tax=Candidatus Uabimicrobium helgolandensis TaxID=3095367 RepID=UPI003557AB6F